jgi:hypothetical protein
MFVSQQHPLVKESSKQSREPLKEVSMIKIVLDPQLHAFLVHIHFYFLINENYYNPF